MKARRIFVAGSTGAVGRTLVALAAQSGEDLVAHMRPRGPASSGRGDPADPRAAVFPLEDSASLDAALAGCTTVVQLIGTMRKRFATGDTYEASDIGTTRLLVESALRTHAVDHFVLLSSVGAGKPRGAYLRAKADAEALVTRSGMSSTIFRPSAFEGEGHKPPPGMATVTKLLGLASLRPIRVEQLAQAILRCARERAPLGVLEGASLWRLVA